MLVHAGASNILYKGKLGNCNITVTHNAVKGRKGVMIISTRSDTLCKVSRDSVNKVLDSALTNLKNKNLSPVTSIFLKGKLRTFQWMSDILVAKSKNNSRWNQKIGSPVKGTLNSYANNILFSDVVLRPFSKPLERFHYKITAVICEKIIINKSKLPYEAMCWLKVKRTGR